MSAPLRDEEPRDACDRRPPHNVRVTVQSPSDGEDVSIGGDCTITQLRRGVAEPEQLVLTHARQAQNNTELLSHCKGQNSEAPKALKPTLTFLSPNPDGVTPPPTSPLYLVEGLDSLGLTNGPDLFPALQRQMESQLLADPELMAKVLGSPFVQSTLGTSTPQLTRQLILSSLQPDPEVADALNNTDIVTQVLEVVRHPGMIQDLMPNQGGAPGHLPQEQRSTHFFPDDSNSTQMTEAQQPVEVQSKIIPQSSQEPNRKERGQTPLLSSQSTDHLTELTSPPGADQNSNAMQSLLEEITADPGLMESLLSGPYVSNLLNCLSQNPDLAAQMLLSHPLFSGNPHVKQQMRQQLPLFLQQMQSPELLSAMLNPKAMEALLQIQHGLETLATEAPALIPAAAFGNTGPNVHATPELQSDSALNNQSGSGPQVSVVTEHQLQQFVQQMLQALTHTSNAVPAEEAELQEKMD